MSDFKNLIIAVVATMAILFGWQYFYELPRIKEHEKQSQFRKQTQSHKRNTNVVKEVSPFLEINDAVANASRIIIKGDKVSGSMSLLGARIDDLTLNDYLSSVKDDKKVRLLHPSKTKDAYFAQFGWIGDNVELPDSNSVWTSNSKVLTSENPVILTWKNNQGVVFEMKITLDNNYMFLIEKTIRNRSGKTIEVQDYGLINRIFAQKEKSMLISHEGPLGVFNGILKEVTYKDFAESKNLDFADNRPGGWFGVGDKYWLTAIAPSKDNDFNVKFQYSQHHGKDRYQVGYLGQSVQVDHGSSYSTTSNFFAGAKVVSILDDYERKYNLDLFDRAIDFGWFYFITKPMFYALKFFYDVVGNFGLSILIVTIIVKIFLFPLANKSYYSMLKMKKLAPEIERMKELYGDDKVKQNQALMDIYKKEKISPLSGCLPFLIQIPILFSLYKVLYITIEMRQAPFFGWIHDLSMPDPTTMFNLFGVLPWNPPAFLMIGAWPIIMALTMFWQQKMSPEPSDPIQAQVMKFLPLIFVFMFASFPAGLVIYWAWGNILSVLQQYFIKIRAYRKENLVI
jgi:YidC/Oxa1 family membrane protein insertase